jgi:hypothetical protein
VLTSSPQCRQMTAVSTPCPHECSNAAGGASTAYLSPQAQRLQDRTQFVAGLSELVLVAAAHALSKESPT